MVPLRERFQAFFGLPVSLNMNEQKKNGDWMRQIDENLRRVYEQTAKEEIPDRFQKLLDQLKDQDARE